MVTFINDILFCFALIYFAFWIYTIAINKMPDIFVQINKVALPIFAVGTGLIFLLGGGVINLIICIVCIFFIVRRRLK